MLIRLTASVVVKRHVAAESSGEVAAAREFGSVPEVIAGVLRSVFGSAAFFDA